MLEGSCASRRGKKAFPGLLPSPVLLECNTGGSAKEQLAFLHVRLEIGGRLRRKSENYVRGSDDRTARPDSRRTPRTSLAEKHSVSRASDLAIFAPGLSRTAQPVKTAFRSSECTVFHTFLWTMASRHYCLVFEAASARRQRHAIFDAETSQVKRLD